MPVPTCFEQILDKYIVAGAAFRAGIVAKSQIQSRRGIA